MDQRTIVIYRPIIPRAIISTGDACRATRRPFQGRRPLHRFCIGGLAVPVRRRSRGACRTGASIGWVSVSRSELVLDFQDDTNEVFIVVEGLVRVVVRTPLGQEVIL